MRPAAAFLALMSLLVATSATAAIVARPAPHAGSVVDAKGDENLMLVEEQSWRPVEIRQHLRGGDSLRTGPFGGLAILFSDQTRIRVSRNSHLLIREMTGQTRLGLSAGSLWARSPRLNDLTVRTPSATAAIRGTDWTLSVSDGTTTLAVVEGSVELRNQFGSIIVTEGEAALAEIGRAPAKIVVVQPDDRSQMLFYLSLRDAFRHFAPTGMSRRQMWAERGRLYAISSSARSAEDWLRIAEIAIVSDGRSVADEALSLAERIGLSGPQSARAQLVRGLLQASDRRYADAAATLAAGVQHLRGRRKVVADWMRYFAELLDGQGERARPPRRQDDPYTYLAQAWLFAYLGEFDKALSVITEGEEKFPDALVLSLLRAQVGVLLYRRDDLAAASERALSIDSDDPLAMAIEAFRLFLVERRLSSAIATLREAVQLMPGDPDVWNTIGLFEHQRGAYIEAEKAFRAAIAVDPDNPVPHGNYAILLLDQHRLTEAKKIIDISLEIDPSFYAALIGQGRLALQRGELREGREALLKANTANPIATDPLLGLSVAYYEDGQIDRAEQSLATADRLNPNDPTVPLIKSVIAADDYEADLAVSNAREAFRRFREEGGLRVNVDAQQDGTYLVSAFSLLGLNEWGDYYNDLVFNPFEAGSHFGRAVSEQNTLVVDQTTSTATTQASIIQGILLDPLAISSRERFTDFFRRPFVDGSIGINVADNKGSLSYGQTFTLQGFDNSGIPVSFYSSGGLSDRNHHRENDESSVRNVSVGLGMNVTPHDRLFVVGQFSDNIDEMPGSTFQPTGEDWNKNRHYTGTVGVSHTFGYRDIIAATVSGRHNDQRDEGHRFDELFGFPFELTSRGKTETDTYGGSVGYFRGIGSTTIRVGGDLYRVDSEAEVEQTIRLLTVDVDPLVATSGLSSRTEIGRTFLDFTHRVSPDLQFQLGAAATMLDGLNEETRFEPRVGAAWSPSENHWLRLAYVEQTEMPIDATLSPTATVGLNAANVPSEIGGEVDAVIARWDSEWSPHFYTNVEYQHLDLEGVGFSVPASLDTFFMSSGSVDRLSAGFNAWVEGGIGLVGEFAYNWNDDDFPFVPEYQARLGLTWVLPSQLRLSLSQNFVGERAANLSDARLDSYLTTDLTASWETANKQLFIEAHLMNLFDDNYDIGINTPSAGRTFLASIRAKF